MRRTGAATSRSGSRGTRCFGLNLGMCSYYHRSIPHFAHISKLLHLLMRKGAGFVWTDQCEDAFQTLKTKLLRAPMLVCKPFVLETDASNSGLGVVLSQSPDHAAVKAVLQTPNPGKLACWWSKVYEISDRCIDIIYKTGKSNTNADALPRTLLDQPFSK